MEVQQPRGDGAVPVFLGGWAWPARHVTLALHRRNQAPTTANPFGWAQRSEAGPHRWALGKFRNHPPLAQRALVPPLQGLLGRAGTDVGDRTAGQEGAIRREDAGSERSGEAGADDWMVDEGMRGKRTTEEERWMKE